MRKLVFILSLLLLATGAFSQELVQVTFRSGGSFSHFSIGTEQDVLIRISEEGKILEWGYEILADRGYYYATQLEAFMGRVEYYGRESDSAFTGKIKSIGTCYITYYGNYEEPFRRGKLRSMGPLFFDYFSDYEEKSVRGKLKQIGSFTLDYYRSYEHQDVRGKLRAIGNMPIAYYSAFEDKYNAGKLKSVGTASYKWYSQYDQGAGALKSNNMRQTVGSITIVLQ